jgi:hypothetical protein
MDGIISNRAKYKIIDFDAKRTMAPQSGLHLVPLGLTRLAVGWTLAMIGLLGDAMWFCHN